MSAKQIKDTQLVITNLTNAIEDLKLDAASPEALAENLPQYEERLAKAQAKLARLQK